MGVIADLVAQAEAAYRANQMRLAAEKYGEAIRHAPNDVGLLERFVYTAGVHSPGAAITAADDFISRHPGDDAVAASLLGLQLPYRDRQARRSRGLPTQVTENIDEPPFVFSKYEVERWHDHAARWASRLPLEPVAGCNMAQVSFSLGRYDECDRWMDLIRPVHPNTMLTGARFSGPFFSDLTEVAKTAITRLPPVETVVRGRTARRIFVGCDQGYFDRFGAVLAKSFALSETDAILHFHVFDPEGSRAKDVLTKTVSNRFALTVEKTPFAGKPAGRLYYASARLIRLLQFMEQAGAPYIFIDADLAIGKSLDPLFDALKDADVALNRMPGRVLLHSQFNASVIGINATTEGLTFLRTLAGFIAKNLLANNAPWGLDQTALVCAHVHRRLKGASARTISAGGAIYGMDLDSALWPQKVASDDDCYPAWQTAMARFT